MSNSNPILQRSVEVEVDCSVQQVYDLWANLAASLNRFQSQIEAEVLRQSVV